MAKISPDDRLKKLRLRVAKAPQDAGVYRWLDANGDVLYVGKAKNLRNRLKSYVQKNPDKNLGPWKLSLIDQITDVNMTVVNSELEAFMLETYLIKDLKPKYNVLMKDDKHYVYVRISMQDPYPRIDIVRKMEQDGAKYFGPKTSAEQVRIALAALRRLYPFRNCKMKIVPALSVEIWALNNQKTSSQSSQPTAQSPIPLEVICTHKDRPTPCLDHHIGHCSAPCIGLKTPEEYYKESIEGVIKFFKGDHEAVKTLLQERMKKAATDKKFELAAEMRDQLKEIELLTQQQLIADASGEDSDFIGVAVLSNRAHVVILQERGGKVIGEESFALAGRADSVADVLDQFLPQYYSDVSDLPDSLFIGEGIEDHDTLQQWLTERRGKKVTIHIPERGKKSKLLELAEKNAQQKAKQQEAKWEAEARNTEDALSQLQELLKLPEKPQRIEGYDISHLGGTETVGSMVVMKGGKPANDQYRSFTIHTMKSGVVDDYRALKEVLTRRLKHLISRPVDEEARWKSQGVTFGRARKGDQLFIESVHERNPGDIGGDAIDYKDYFVAREEGGIIGFGRLFKYPGNVLTIRSIWVAEDWRGNKLGQFLVRKMLRSVKKGKVYLHSKDELIEYYGSLGFKQVWTPPAVLQKKIETYAAEHPSRTPGVIMVYDTKDNGPDSSLSSLPDLLVIDGGKGQLSTVVEVLKKSGLEIPVIGLAKREEEVFIPSSSLPVIFPKDSAGKFLLMRLRDEAHRSANRHRERRASRSMTS